MKGSYQILSIRRGNSLISGFESGRFASRVRFVWILHCASNMKEIQREIQREMAIEGCMAIQIRCCLDMLDCP